MIVYEDNVLLVVHKPPGIATETAKAGKADLVSELKNYRERKGEETYIGVIHRLDQPVEGLLVFAKNAEAAKKLSARLQDGSLAKKYIALAAGIPSAQEGELRQRLIERKIAGGSDPKEALDFYEQSDHRNVIQVLTQHHEANVELVMSDHRFMKKE